MLTVVIHLTIFKAWPNLIIMKMMSHLQLILSKIVVWVVIQSVIHCYIKPLVFLINQSLTEGVFPDELKLDKVIPVFKAGSSMELSNYRPISVLYFFKSLKNLCITPWYFILINIISFIKINCFLQRHSSHHALITLVNKITQSLDSGDHGDWNFPRSKKRHLTQ